MWVLLPAGIPLSMVGGVCFSRLCNLHVFRCSRALSVLAFFYQCVSICVSYCLYQVIFNFEHGRNLPNFDPWSTGIGLYFFMCVTHKTNVLRSQRMCC